MHKKNDSAYKEGKYTRDFPVLPFGNKKTNQTKQNTNQPTNNQPTNSTKNPNTKLHESFHLPSQIASLWTLLQRSPKEGSVQIHLQIPARCKSKVDRNTLARDIS